MDNNFVFIVCGRNSEKYIKRCLDSILSQSYTNYKICIIDDASTDYTQNLITDYVSSHSDIKHKFICMFNVDRKYGLRNKWENSKNQCISPEDIVVILDADDYLTDNKSLNRIDDEYKNSNIWATYGNYKNESDGQVRENHEVVGEFNRLNPSCYISHVRTFKRHLLDHIEEKYLMDLDGEFFKVVDDLTMEFPIIELCGRERVSFIPEPIMVYNDLNGYGESRTAAREQSRVDALIRTYPVYEKL